MNCSKTITGSLISVIGFTSYARLTKFERVGRRVRNLLFLLAVNLISLSLPAGKIETRETDGAEWILGGGYFLLGFFLASPGEILFGLGCLCYLLGFKHSTVTLAVLTLPFAYLGSFILSGTQAYYAWITSFSLLLIAGILMPKPTPAPTKEPAS